MSAKVRNEPDFNHCGTVCLSYTEASDSGLHFGGRIHFLSDFYYILFV
jgi:hypothetical protein